MLPPRGQGPPEGGVRSASCRFASHTSEAGPAPSYIERRRRYRAGTDAAMDPRYVAGGGSVLRRYQGALVAESAR